MLKPLVIGAVLLGALAGGANAAPNLAGEGGVGVQIHPEIGGGKMCLDASGNRDRNGVPVIAYACNQGANQKWTISTSTDNQHAIIGLDGLCLDVRGASSRANGTPVQLYSCHFGANQRFSLSQDGRIREAASGKCLIAMIGKPGSPVVLDDCSNSPDEVFSLHHY